MWNGNGNAYLQHDLGDGYEWWPNFYEFHKLAIDELNAFEYDKYKKNGCEASKIMANSRFFCAMSGTNLHFTRNTFVYYG